MASSDTFATPGRSTSVSRPNFERGRAVIPWLYPFRHRGLALAPVYYAFTPTPHAYPLCSGKSQTQLGLTKTAKFRLIKSPPSLSATSSEARERGRRANEYRPSWRIRRRHIAHQMSNPLADNPHAAKRPTSMATPFSGIVFKADERKILQIKHKRRVLLMLIGRAR